MRPARNLIFLTDTHRNILKTFVQLFFSDLQYFLKYDAFKFSPDEDYCHASFWIDDDYPTLQWSPLASAWGLLHISACSCMVRLYASYSWGRTEGYGFTFHTILMAYFTFSHFFLHHFTFHTTFSFAFHTLFQFWYNISHFILKSKNNSDSKAIFSLHIY